MQRALLPIDSLDKIVVEDLRLRCFIGFQPWETEKQQDVLITFTLFYQPIENGQDKIENALNYKTITKQVIHLVEQSRSNLIETLAENIAVCILKEPRVKAVKLNVTKPSALRFSKSVSVEIFRVSPHKATEERNG